MTRYFVIANDGHVFALSGNKGRVIYTNQYGRSGRVDYDYFMRLICGPLYRTRKVR